MDSVLCKRQDDRRQSDARVFDLLRIIAEVRGDRSPYLVKNHSEDCLGVGVIRCTVDQPAGLSAWGNSFWESSPAIAKRVRVAAVDAERDILRDELRP
jgi:hypothetical protein